MIVAGVILCSAVIWFMGEYAMKSDQEEYAKRCKSFEGIWSDKDKQLTVEIHRVSSGFLFFSITNHKFSRDLKLLRAYAVGDDMYEFSYGTEANKTGGIYKIKPGSEGKGTFHLQDDRVKVDFPRIPNKSRGLEYSGTLTNKSALPSQNEYHLAEYLGTKKKMATELKEYCSFGYGADGTIWRVHAMISENNERYKTDIVGINMNSTEQECEQTLGKLTSEIKLDDRGSRRQYENDTYISTVFVNSFGVITELDCQLAKLPGTTREGDFLMQGNTLYRYTGDYSQEKTIEIPERTTQIASHAFDAGEHGYTLSRGNRKTSNIDISSKIKVEEDAFANCGPLKIYLKSGWKEIPEGAFAHTVSKENLLRKDDWVTIVLPPTIQKIGDRAFAIGESDKELDEYWTGIDRPSQNAVSVRAAGFSTWKTSYIGDDAFWGIPMAELPEGLEYLGKNYTLNAQGEYVHVPKSLTTLKKGSLYLLGYCRIVFSGKMEDIEEGSIRGIGGTTHFTLSLSEKSGNIVESDEPLCKWIVSKDGKIIYAINWPEQYIAYDYDYYDDDDYYDDEDYDDDDYDDEDYDDDYDDEDDEDDEDDDYEDDDYEDDDYDDEDYDDEEDDDEYEEGYREIRKLLQLHKNSNYRINQKNEISVKIPEGVEEIRGYANLRYCSEITVPKSVKRMSTEAFFNRGYWDKIVFLGDVPELYGDLSAHEDDEGYLHFSGTIQVKKGQKEKLLKQLMGDKKYSKKRKKELAKCITTF